MTINLRGVDPDIHRKLRIIVASEETNVSELLRRLMAEYVERHKHLLPPEKKKPGGTVRSLGDVKPRKQTWPGHPTR